MSKAASRQLPTPEDDSDQKLLDDVRDFGWHVIAIGDDEEGPGFAYSIGLFHNFGHPEIVTFGLDIETMHVLINEIGEEIRNGVAYEDLEEVGNFLEDYNVIFRKADVKHYREYLGYARWFYQGDDFPVLQCSWPDQLHRFPWQPEFPQELKASQPALFDEASWPFAAGANRAVYATKPIVKKGQAILTVVHDEEDDWLFLCGTTDASAEPLLVSLNSLVSADPSLRECADLPEGWVAMRTSPTAKWQREPQVDEDE